MRTLGSRFYYPDVMAVCDENDMDDYIKERPCLIVEVLSRSTANTDRREKVDAYLSLPSLQSYILVDSQMKRIECVLPGRLQAGAKSSGKEAATYRSLVWTPR